MEDPARLRCCARSQHLTSLFPPTAGRQEGLGHHIFMPSIRWSQQRWNNRYYWDWADDGETWSANWGGSTAQWLTTIYPRLAPFLPTGSLVEIAPGKGRWTQYLLPHCASYLGVDVAELAVASCQKRFAGHSGVQFAVNDGLSLPMVDDGSADLVFSFDSLVHAEADVIGAYSQEFRRILNPVGGVAFIHHSNLGVYHASAAVRDLLGHVFDAFSPTEAFMTRIGLAGWHGDRSRSVTAARFAELARSAGLACIGQEVISWGSPLLIDCISVLTLPGSKWDRESVYVRNRHFHSAARSSASCAKVFAPDSRVREHPDDEAHT